MERLKEIEAELSGIAPILGKSGITGQPYAVPAGYFEHFAENLLAENPDGSEKIRVLNWRQFHPYWQD